MFRIKVSHVPIDERTLNILHVRMFQLAIFTQRKEFTHFYLFESHAHTESAIQLEQIKKYFIRVVVVGHKQRT